MEVVLSIILDGCTLTYEPISTICCTTIGQLSNFFITSIQFIQPTEIYRGCVVQWLNWWMMLTLFLDHETLPSFISSGIGSRKGFKCDLHTFL